MIYEAEVGYPPGGGPMPGYMNALPAQAGAPYDRVFDLDEINAEFEIAEVTLIIGANDLVNPGARSDTSSPIYGMPFLNANKGNGFSGIENLLFCLHRIRILCGAGQQAAGQLNHAMKELGWKSTDRAPHGGY